MKKIITERGTLLVKLDDGRDAYVLEAGSDWNGPHCSSIMINGRACSEEEATSDAVASVKSMGVGVLNVESA